MVEVGGGLGGVEGAGVVLVGCGVPAEEEGLWGVGSGFLGFVGGVEGIFVGFFLVEFSVEAGEVWGLGGGLASGVGFVFDVWGSVGCGRGGGGGQDWVLQGLGVGFHNSFIFD